jgi:aldehyde dehydrogenase (NAD+)
VNTETYAQTSGASDSSASRTCGNFIGGEWRPSSTGATFEDRDPADARELIGEFARSDARDADLAVAAARSAFPSWRALPAPKRGEILYRFAGMLARDKERVSREVTREMGKVIEESRGDVQEAIDIAYLYAGEGRRLAGETVPSELPDKSSMSIREPIGVAAIITPWNVPAAIPALRLMPALIAGNTVVWKPASETPSCAVQIVELLAEAGVPRGVVNLVTGGGEEVGTALVRHPDIDIIAFTGSTSVGRSIASIGADHLKRVTLEMGGKNAMVIMGDADIELAAESVIWAAFGTTGQRCTACSRLIVHDDAYDPLMAALQRRIAALRIGPGLDPATDVGPLVNRAAVDKFGRYLELARGDGEIVCGGDGLAREERLEHGHFVAPALVAGVDLDHPLAQEEIFGPLLTVFRVPDYEAAAKAVNKSRYGLSSSIFTSDLRLAFRALRDFHTGLVYVNGGTIGAETQLPFGGVGDTGNGHRDSGRAGLDNFTEWKTVYIDYSGRLQRAQIDNQAPA